MGYIRIRKGRNISGLVIFSFDNEVAWTEEFSHTLWSTDDIQRRAITLQRRHIDYMEIKVKAAGGRSWENI